MGTSNMTAVHSMRMSTGLTQKEFAEAYNIPLATYKKWEQGESSPAPYLLSLIARTLPSEQENLVRFSSADGKQYYYDAKRKMVFDELGNGIQVSEDLSGIKESNLCIYLRDLFSSFYEIQNRFNRDCELDKTANIDWI